MILALESRQHPLELGQLQRQQQCANEWRNKQMPGRFNAHFYCSLNLLKCTTFIIRLACTYLCILSLLFASFFDSFTCVLFADLPTPTPTACSGYKVETHKNATPQEQQQQEERRQQQHKQQHQQQLQVELAGTSISAGGQLN